MPTLRYSLMHGESVQCDFSKGQRVFPYGIQTTLIQRGVWLIYETSIVTKILGIKTPEHERYKHLACSLSLKEKNDAKPILLFLSFD